MHRNELMAYQKTMRNNMVYHIVLYVRRALIRSLFKKAKALRPSKNMPAHTIRERQCKGLLEVYRLHQIRLWLSGDNHKLD